MSKQSPGLLPVFLTVFIDLLGFGIVIPLLPIYAEHYGASKLTLGLLFSSFSLMQFVFAPFWGRLSDKIGRRPVLVGGLFGTAFAYVLFGLADSMTMLFVSRILAGFFGANVPTAQAYVADVTTPENRAKGMGMIGAAFGLGFTFGPAIGGAMYGLSPMAPGFTAAGLSLCAAMFGLLRLSEPEVHRDDASRIFGLAVVRTAAADRRIWTLLLLYFLAIFAFSGFESMFIISGIERFPHVFGFDHAVLNPTDAQLREAAWKAGWYMFGIGLMAAFIQGGLIRRLVPRFGESKLIVAGPFLLGLSLAIVGAAPTWSIVIVGCVLMPFGFGINNPSLNSLLSRTVPAEQQGGFLGLNQSLASLARVVGPLVAAAVFQCGDASKPFYLSAGLLAVATLIAFGYRKRYRLDFERSASASAE